MKYLKDLRIKINAEEGCHAKHVVTVPVKETFKGQTVWDGDVEVFDLIGHPKALRCYAWGHPVEDAAKEREMTVVLEIPPVSSAETAVKVALASKARLNSK